MRTTRFRDVIAGVLVAAGLSVASTASHALPEYAAAVNAVWQVDFVGCSFCHLDPAGGGPGNGFSDSYYARFAAVPTHKTDPQGAALIVGYPTTTTTTLLGATTTTETTTSTTIPPGGWITIGTTVSTTSTTVSTSSTIPSNSTTVTGSTTTTASSTTTTTFPNGTTTSSTTTSTSSTTTTTQPASGAALYGSYCASCHDGAAAAGGGRNVLGARTCSIDGALNGTQVFSGGVPAMQFLKGMLSAEQIRLISNYLNVGPVTGQQRYITACAGCHGADARGGRVGEGVRGSNPGEIRGAIREDEGGMGVVKCLPATDINAISSYLRGKIATTRPSTTTTSSTTTTHRRH